MKIHRRGFLHLERAQSHRQAFPTLLGLKLSRCDPSAFWFPLRQAALLTRLLAPRHRR